jgi:hypothetical protein
MTGDWLHDFFWSLSGVFDFFQPERDRFSVESDRKTEDSRKPRREKAASRELRGQRTMSTSSRSAPECRKGLARRSGETAAIWRQQQL